MNKRLAIAGSGAIACGLAATAAHHGPVLLLARSTELRRASARDRREDPQPPRRGGGPRARADRDRPAGARRRRRSSSRRWSRTTTSRPACSRELDAMLDSEAILASTTSSLSVERLAQASGRPERFLGLHVFNPVTRMKLVELIFPEPPRARDAQPRAGAVRGLREDPRGGARRARVRRQPPAVPLSVQRGAPARRDGDGPGRRRHLHEARRRAPDGAAGAARPRRPRRLQGDRRDDRRDDPAARRRS